MNLNKKKKLKNKWAFSVIGCAVISFGLTTGVGVAVTNNISQSQKNLNENNLIPFSSVSRNEANKIKPLVPSEFINTNGTIVSNSGPIISWGNKISSVDWFGAERWSIDAAQFLPNGVSSSNWVSAWNRAFTNWAINRKENILYFTTNKKRNDLNSKQRLIGISIENGKTVLNVDIDNLGTDLLFSLQVLANNNVVIFSPGGDKLSNILYDVKTKTQTKIISERPEIMSNIPGNIKESRIVVNIIPISVNKNIFVSYNSNNSETGNTGYNAWIGFVDDKMQPIIKDTSNQWNKSVKVTTNPKRYYQDVRDRPSPSFFQLLDGRIVTFFYNTILLIDSKKSNSDGLVYQTKEVEDDVVSWTVDTENNIFYKLKNSTEIRKLPIIQNGFGQSSVYYNLQTSQNQKIKDNSTNFQMYPVYNHSGTLMLISNNNKTIPNNNNLPNTTQTSNYGLAMAISKNPYDNRSGDSQGLLNTDEAFQFSADFLLPDNIIGNKLPSEIISNDLIITNRGFLTKKANCIPFSKVMDEKAGTLEVTAYIDQIPWFISDGKMPSNILPTKITKKYTGLNQIESRISWKQTSSDYDFKNTLPSKVNSDDLKRFDPATFNLNSQTVVDTSGKIIYPKKTYSIKSVNDENGEISIKAKYDYMPLGVASIPQNALSVESEHTYIIFKKTDSKQFVFTGQTNSKSKNPVDVKVIAELNEFLKKDILPSCFSSLSKNSNSLFLHFINTNLSAGYPTSKMAFSFVANDQAGTLTINAKLPENYYPDSVASNSFSQVYTGLNKESDYLFQWKNKPDLSNKHLLLPSQIMKSEIFSKFVNYRGFNPLDMDVQLFPDDFLGTLKVQIILKGKYTEKIKTSNNFRKTGNLFITSKIYSDFLTKNKQNNQYKLVFKKDSDFSLNSLKKFTGKQIYDAFNSNSQRSTSGLNLNGKNYKTLKNLVSELLIESSGVSLPDILDEKVNVNMYFNNGNGTLDFIVQYPDSAKNLIFVGHFTGFVLGNDISTEDTLCFKTQLGLETEINSIISEDNSLYKLFNKNPDEFKEWLDNSENLKKLISYHTGQYSDLIDQKNIHYQFIQIKYMAMYL